MLKHWPKADTVIRALELPSTFKVDKYLTNVVDYTTKEVISRQEGQSKGKIQKVSRTEYFLNDNGITKLSAIARKCSIKTINDFSATMALPLPVVYLFVVANDSLGIDVPDNHILVKYGYTNNLHRRMNEHVKTYGPGIFLKYHVYIDPTFLKEAENDIRSFFFDTKWHVLSNKYTELAVIPAQYLNNVVSAEYKRVGEHYLHKVSDINAKCASFNQKLEFSEKLLEEKERSLSIALKFIESKNL